MIKRGAFLILLFLIFGSLTIQADYLGVKKNSETISFFLNEPLDTAGLPTLPDSAHVFTYADNASAATFTTRSTTYPFSAISIDTLKIYGDTIYVFADAIADIDGAGGNFELAIEVKLFGDGLPISTHATVQVVADSLPTYLTAITTAAGDVVNIDAWDPVLDNDSLIMDQSSLSARPAIGDTIQRPAAKAGDAMALTTAERGSIEDSVYAQRAGYKADVSDVADTVNAIIDSLQHPNTYKASLTNVTDTVNAIIDSLQHPNTYKSTGTSTFDPTASCVTIQDTLCTGDSVAVMPDFWSAADSTAYQGAASGLTKAQVADTTWKKFTDGANEDQFKADVSALALDGDITTLQTAVTNAASDIDSLSWWLGAEIGCYSYTHLNTGADTMWIVNGSNDTLSLFIFFHPGGAAGDPPDSFKVVAP